MLSNRSRRWYSLPTIACVTVFGVGLLPGKLLNKPGKGGGLMGSLATLPLLWVLRERVDVWAWVTVFITILGICVVPIGENEQLRMFGPQRRHTGELVTQDFNSTCIDEVLGMQLACWPMLLTTLSTRGYLFLLTVGFVLFRIFDVKKPFPIWWVERTTHAHSGISVMIDDAVAGVMASSFVFLLVDYAKML